MTRHIPKYIRHVLSIRHVLIAVLLHSSVHHKHLLLLLATRKRVGVSLVNLSDSSIAEVSDEGACRVKHAVFARLEVVGLEGVKPHNTESVLVYVRCILESLHWYPIRFLFDNNYTHCR